MARINELSKLHTRPGHQLTKCGIIGDVMLGSGGFILVVCTSNLLKSVFNFLGLSSSQDERIHEIEQDLSYEQNRIATFEENFNITRHINIELIKSIKELSKAIENNHREIQKLAHDQITLSWTITYLQGKIASSANLLDSIIAKYNQGLVATRQLGELLNMTELMQIDDKDTMVGAIALKGKSTITFKFSIREKSKDTEVFRMITFKHWTNLGIKRQLMEYDGMEFAIFNRTNNCIRGIEPPMDRFVFDECMEPNHVDSRLNKWRKIDPEKEKRIPYPINSVRTTSRANYVYCYKDNITISNHTYDCPTEVFRLPIDTIFNLAGFRYKLSKRTILTLQSLPAVVDKIHPTHFTEPLAGSTKIINYLNEMLNATNQYDIDDQHRPPTNYHQYIGWGIGSGTIILLLIAVIGIQYKFNAFRREVIYETIELSRRHKPKPPSYAPPPVPKPGSDLKGAC